MAELIEVDGRGLACEAGGFHVDPWRPVERAIVTHAHADHARPGSRHYLTTPDGAAVLARRVQADARIEVLDYGEQRRIGDVLVSLHSAGHVLGSAQVRVERGGEVWVVSGDYKTSPDPTCRPFEPVACHTFITESTFGLPVFAWPRDEHLKQELLAWWAENRAANRTSLLCAYALGKAQRVLALIGDDAPGPLGVHGAVARLNEAYATTGVALPSVRYADAEAASELAGRGLIVAPPSVNGTPWMRKFGDVATGFASGWMRLRGPRRRRNFDRGFVLSDHADWPGLLASIDATGAERVLVTHGYVEPLVRFLRESRGLRADPLVTRFVGEPEEADGQDESEGGDGSKRSA